jgi:hypothetical protein
VVEEWTPRKHADDGFATTRSTRHMSTNLVNCNSDRRWHTRAQISALSMADMFGCNWRIAGARGSAGGSDEGNDKVERQRTSNSYTASQMWVRPWSVQSKSSMAGHVGFEGA